MPMASFSVLENFYFILFYIQYVNGLEIYLEYLFQS